MLSDTRYQEQVIERVVCSGKGFELTLDHGGFFVPNPNGLPAPQVGQTARLYGEGFGRPVRGFAIGDCVYFYVSSEDYSRRVEAGVAVMKAQRREQWYKEPVAQRIAAMVAPLQERFNGFLLRRSSFGPEYGLYELMVCEDAGRIAEACRDGDDVAAFKDLSFAEQQERVKDLSPGHSGNTMGAALRLAWLLKTDPAAVPKEHGAMCPMMGCKEVGCARA